jgi:hypothetical protein
MFFVKQKEINMAERIQWEYRVQTIGSIFGTKDEAIQTLLNEWGEDSWEVIHVYNPESSGQVTIVAKRLLTERTRRQRSLDDRIRQ